MIIRLLLAIYLLMPLAGYAEEAYHEALSTNYGIVDEVVSLGFVPRHGFLLVEKQLGEVQQRAIEVLPYQDGQALVGSVVDCSKNESNRIVFFLRGDRELFAATPVRSYSSQAMKANASSLAELQEKILLLDREQSGVNESLAQVELTLKKLRNEASSITGVSDIVELKKRLSQVVGYEEKGEAEQGRLRRLIESGKSVEEPAQIDQRRQALSLQLQQVAQLTASAEKISARTQSLGKTSLEKKLNLIKETAQYDAELLAKQLLDLRSRRVELEKSILGVSNTYE
jgi:hypothetical protein